MEYQYSVIPKDEVVKRTEDYIKEFYFPIWILYEKNMTRKKNVIYFNDFISAFIMKYSRSSPKIISFLPDEELLFVTDTIIPYSANRAFVTVKKMTFNHSLEEIFSSRPFTISFYNDWMPLTEKWIIRQSLLPNARGNPFLKFLYNMRIHPTELPPEIGLPVRYGFLIETPPFEWQFFIWYYFLFTRKKGEQVQVTELLRFVQHKMKRYIRFGICLYFKTDYLTPIYEYICLLANLGYYRKTGDTLIIKRKPLLIDNANRYRFAIRKEFFRRNKTMLLRPFLSY